MLSIGIADKNTLDEVKVLIKAVKDTVDLNLDKKISQVGLDLSAADFVGLGQATIVKSEVDVLREDLEVVSSVSTAYVIARKYSLNVPGVLNFVYDYRCATGGATIDTRVLLNSVLVGTAASTSSGGFLTKTVEVGVALGDVVELQIKTANGAHPVEVRNVALKATVKVGSVVKIV